MPQTKDKAIVISPPNLGVVTFRIVGTTPYVQNKFSAKARDIMKQNQIKLTRSSTKREPKNFDELYEGAKHVSDEGWYGIPASGFRAAMISACRLAKYKMTLAKLSVFCLEDGYDADDNTGLVRIIKGDPEMVEHVVRFQMTTDVRVRPMWSPGWEADVKFRYDKDQFGMDDVYNLMMRVGMQVGIGEGRNDSKTSVGMGWGNFIIENVYDPSVSEGS